MTEKCYATSLKITKGEKVAKLKVQLIAWTSLTNIPGVGLELKNVEITYQRLMDNIFIHQLGRNLEVYVDDMVLKSTNTTSQAKDLAEIFPEIRKHNMRLNPKKCTFDV